MGNTLVNIVFSGTDLSVNLQNQYDCEVVRRVIIVSASHLRPDRYSRVNTIEEKFI